MDNFVENNDDRFANGQSSCDLQINPDATEAETRLDVVNAVDKRSSVASEEFPAPIGKLLGLMVTNSGSGRATVEFEASERYANPMGTVHGGVLCDLADAAMGVAYRSTVAAGDTFTTIELKINFIRPVWKGKLRAEARVIRAGSVVGLVECDIYDERRRLVARASSTCMTLRGRLSAGRHLTPNQRDADELIRGYLHEPHLPQFESRSTRNFAESVVANADAIAASLDANC